MNKNIGVARVLTVIFPGLGHIYIGDWILGIILAALWGWFGIIQTVPKILMFALGVVDSDYLGRIILLPFLIWVLSIMSMSGGKRKIKNKDQEESL